MLTLVQRARRRLFHNELFKQGAHAAAAILGALILLLLVGTEFLDWPWMALIAAVAVAGALYQSRRHLLTPYATAQVIDRRMELADTISTAVHFEQPSATASPAIREFQRQRADQAAESVDVHRAVPYVMPRGVYLLAVLALVAGSLFGLRYGMLGHLDLHPPLTHMLAEQLGWKTPTQVARNAKRPAPLVPEPDDDSDAAASEPDQKQQMQPDMSSENNDASVDSAAEKGDPTKGDAKKDGERGAERPDADQDAQAETSPSSGDPKAGDQASKQDPKQQSGGKSDPNQSSENSLLNKAKDFMQNLLSSLKPPSSNPGGDQQKDQNSQGNKGQQKQGDKNGQQKSSGQQGDQQQGEQGEQMESQDMNAQGQGKSDSQQATKQAGSGAGSQEGDKRIKQAEDLAAMGKITEILGKRANTLTGEATIEVQNTSQQLKTAYAPGAAQHGQSGGEINRDEVPVAMEPFVQEYFKQARKSEPAAAPPSVAPAAAQPPASQQPKKQ